MQATAKGMTAVRNIRFVLAPALILAAAGCTPFPDFPPLTETQGLPPAELVDLATLEAPDAEASDPGPAVLARAAQARRRAAE